MQAATCGAQVDREQVACEQAALQLAFRQQLEQLDLQQQWVSKRRCQLEEAQRQATWLQQRTEEAIGVAITRYSCRQGEVSPHQRERAQMPEHQRGLRMQMQQEQWQTPPQEQRQTPPQAP